MTADEVCAIAQKNKKLPAPLPDRLARRIAEEDLGDDAAERVLFDAYVYAQYEKNVDAWLDEAVEHAIREEQDRKADRIRYEAMTAEEYRAAIDELVPSAEMREHLYENRLCISDFHDLAVAAAVPLEVKEKYASTEDRREIRAAIDALDAKPGELFYLFDAWYDDDIGGEKTSGNAPFTSIEKVLESIREESSFYDEGDSFYDTCYYIVEKWALDENGDYRKQYIYWFVREEPTYFRCDGREINRRLESGRLRFSFGAHCLGLPAPFKVGDIVTVDCTPFAPRVRGVVIENFNEPTVGFQIIYREPFTRRWRTCSLRSGLWIEGIESSEQAMISPMLRLARYDGELKESERILARVRDYIGGDEAKGHALWDEINTCTDKHDGDAELLALVSEISAANNEAAMRPRERGVPEEAYDFDEDDACSDGSEFEDGELPF